MDQATVEGVPFDKISRKSLLEHIKSHLKEAEARVTSIAENPETPTFENTSAALEKALSPVYYASSLLSNLHLADADEDLRSQAPEARRLETEFSTNLHFNQKLFKRIEKLHANKSSLASAEQVSIVEKNYRDFVRNGALLPSEHKDEFRTLSNRLAQLSVTFGQNVLDATNRFELWIANDEDLKGLPQSFASMLKEQAKAKGRPAEWLVNLLSPSYLPFMTYSENRELREKLYRAYSARCLDGSSDNSAVCFEMARLRKRKAELLGFRNYAEFALEDRMAKTPETVQNLVDDLRSHALPKALEEVRQLRDLAGADFEGPLQPWDLYYYMEKLKAQTLSVSDENIKPFFECHQTIRGFFDLSSRLFNLRFEEAPNSPKYHPDVITFRVLDANEEDKFLGLLYLDLYSRPSKAGGAWKTTFITQGQSPELEGRPIVSIVCNFTPPQGANPSLLTFNEALTLFHEGGHALHELLSKCEYLTLSGTKTKTDFVELPSQFMENWLFEPSVVQTFATHYQTGAVLDEKALKQLRDLGTFMSGVLTLRQLSFSYIDMAWHHTFDPSSEASIEELEKSAIEPAQLLPWVDGTSVSPSFRHIFDGGYAAGYYGYKWAEVLDADAFEAFKEEGLMSTQVAERFRRALLEKGGSEDPSKLFQDFRGRPPSATPLMKRCGFLEANP